MSRTKPVKSEKGVSFEPSHAPFKDLISYNVREPGNPFFRDAGDSDHIAELCLLQLDDTEDVTWFGGPTSDGVVMREMFDRLCERIRNDHDLEAAEILYALATHAAYEVLGLYLRHRKLFNQIAPRRRMLPCLISIHPKTAKVVSQMEKDARLGEKTSESQRIRSTAWFTSDAPANVYARAIISSVQLNRFRDPVDVQQASWTPYVKQHGQRIIVQPFPGYINGLDRLPFPMTPRSVLAYWRKGKEMILEEMPNFHLRPEWKSYHRRNYQHGAKKGAIQHAIFKDILAALRTIAGPKKKTNHSGKRKKASPAK